VVFAIQLPTSMFTPSMSFSAHVWMKRSASVLRAAGSGS
jgi:hypothetical protein